MGVLLLHPDDGVENYLGLDLVVSEHQALAEEQIVDVFLDDALIHLIIVESHQLLYV